MRIRSTFDSGSESSVVSEPKIRSASVKSARDRAQTGRAVAADAQNRDLGVAAAHVADGSVARRPRQQMRPDIMIVHSI